MVLLLRVLQSDASGGIWGFAGPSSTFSTLLGFVVYRELAFSSTLLGSIPDGADQPPAMVGMKSTSAPSINAVSPLAGRPSIMIIMVGIMGERAGCASKILVMRSRK